MDILGIDIGGSYIKGAVVNTDTGQLISAPQEIKTPQPATPKTVIAATGELVRSFSWHDFIGYGFPAVVQNGVVKTAANIDVSWIGVDVADFLLKESGCYCSVSNDADAAGLAEMRFGAGKGRVGTVLILTLGTGIGSALFHNGQLFPNLELGCLLLHGIPAEHNTSASVRKKENLSWKVWSERLNRFLNHVERLCSPELIVVGGGVSARHGSFLPLIKVQAELVPAHFFNQAGIVGAACFAADRLRN